MRRIPDPMRVVVFTAAKTLTPVNRVFFERIARDPMLCLAGIVVDECPWSKRRSLPARIARGLRRDGWTWLKFKLATMAGRLIRRGALFIWELAHPAVRDDESFDAFHDRTGIPVYRVADIHSEQSLSLIRSLRPQLGVILGGRILKDSVLRIPERGTLNIHKRKVPQYRGGGPIGYWEVLAGERAIGVTIHVAIAEVDAGPVLGELEIPIEECDTLESLQIKADIAGACLFHEVIRDVALGRRTGVPQDSATARTYRNPSEPKVWRLERRLKQRMLARMPVLRHRPSWLVQAGVLIQYAALLPFLLAVRSRLVRRRQAPVCMLCYHVVSNRAVNQMCLPLDCFVRQVEFLRRHVDLLSLDDAVERLRSGTNDRVGAVLTFDDGYQDNRWAIEYLRYFDIPATFFVSGGHVQDGTLFEHDRRLGVTDAPPMRRDDVRQLTRARFTIGSHALHHEDFATLDGSTMDRVLGDSGDVLATMTGQRPEHFSFPIGQVGRQVTATSLTRALDHYRYVYSAYGGYNFPVVGLRHFLRIGNPSDLVTLAMILDGYTGFRACLCGNAWGQHTWRRGLEDRPVVSRRSDLKDLGIT
jgi:peptidoglycan/xylan/chitin deacetylase (PgdA/CDA1 family)